MKKLSKAIQLLWKAHKREQELKEEIKSLNNKIKLNEDNIKHTMSVTDFMHETIEQLHRKIECDETIIDELKEKLQRNGHIIRYRIQKYILPSSMSYDSIGTKMSEENFKHLVEDSKLKMVNEMIEKGLIKMIEYDDCVEITIHLAEDDK